MSASSVTCWAITNETNIFESASPVCETMGLKRATMLFQDVKIGSMEVKTVNNMSVKSFVKQNGSSDDGNHTCFIVH